VVVFIENMINEKKIAEWRKWGKEAYKSSRNMAKTNSHHPDYNTPEKVEALYDRYGDSYMITDKWIEKLKSPKWNYTDEDVSKAFEAFKDGYNSSRQWYKKNDVKFQTVINNYKPIIEVAEQFARSVDVSDIKDGFPCGSAHLYIQNCGEMEELRKAVGHFATSESEVYKYRLPIKLPRYGQCINYDERICKEVSDFLRSNGIFVNTYSWID
jgi:hypothetical protein